METKFHPKTIIYPLFVGITYLAVLWISNPGIALAAALTVAYFYYVDPSIPEALLWFALVVSVGYFTQNALYAYLAGVGFSAALQTKHHFSPPLILLA